VEVFEPEGEVELSGGEVAGGDEAEDGVLDLGRKFGEGVAGTGAGDGVEFVQAELIVDGDGGGGTEGRVWLALVVRAASMRAARRLDLGRRMSAAMACRVANCEWLRFCAT